MCEEGSYRQHKEALPKMLPHQRRQHEQQNLYVISCLSLSGNMVPNDLWLVCLYVAKHRKLSNSHPFVGHQIFWAVKDHLKISSDVGLPSLIVSQSFMPLVYILQTQKLQHPVRVSQQRKRQRNAAWRKRNKSFLLCDTMLLSLLSQPNTMTEDCVCRSTF